MNLLELLEALLASFLSSRASYIDTARPLPGAEHGFVLLHLHWSFSYPSATRCTAWILSQRALLLSLISVHRPKRRIFHSHNLKLNFSWSHIDAILQHCYVLGVPVPGHCSRACAMCNVQDLAIGATSTFFLVSAASKTSFTNKKVENCSSFGASDS